MTQRSKPKESPCYEHYVEYAEMLREMLAKVDTVDMLALVERLNNDNGSQTLTELAASAVRFADEQIGDFVLAAAVFTLMTELELRRGVKPA